MATKKLHWISFCDTRRPPGTQFLGAVLVEGHDFPNALHVAWGKDINPGGQAAGIEVAEECAAMVPERFKDKLMNRAECEEFDALMEARLAEAGL